MAMFLARIKRALNLGTKSITANGTYTASSDGYDGYSSVEVNVSGGTLTNLTPSNASPATITSGTDYHATAGGYAIASYNNVTPSNSSPVALTSGDIDKMGGNGYAIQSYSSKTPDDSNPPSVSSGSIIKVSSYSGYLYKTQQSMTVDLNPYTNGTTRTCTMKNGVYFTSRTDGTTYASYLKGYVQNGVNHIIVNHNSGSTVTYNTSTHELSCTKGTTSQGTNDIWFFIFN